jgi:hypothetical protein
MEGSTAVSKGIADYLMDPATRSHSPALVPVLTDRNQGLGLEISFVAGVPVQSLQVKNDKGPFPHAARRMGKLPENFPKGGSQ